jgi:hypothetical protein
VPEEQRIERHGVPVEQRIEWRLLLGFHELDGSAVAWMQARARELDEGRWMWGSAYVALGHHHVWKGGDRAPIKNEGVGFQIWKALEVEDGRGEVSLTCGLHQLAVEGSSLSDQL